MSGLQVVYEPIDPLGILLAHQVRGGLLPVALVLRFELVVVRHSCPPRVDYPSFFYIQMTI